jgi:large subunit ribosomal protein L35e
MEFVLEDLRKLGKEELEKKIYEMKAEKLLQRQKSKSGDVKPEEIKLVRKNYAKLLKIRKEKILLELVEKYRGTPIPKLPKELRPKFNKATRQRLTKAQLARKTTRQRKRECIFPRVIFAYKE